MKCLAVCQSELVIRTLDQVLVPGFDTEFIVESRPLARKLVEDGLKVTVADPRRVDTYLKADVSPGTVVIIEDNGRRSLRRIVAAARDAGATLVYLLVSGTSTSRADDVRAHFPEVTRLSLAELMGSTLAAELERSVTRPRCSSTSATSPTRAGCSSCCTTTPTPTPWQAASR